MDTSTRWLLLGAVWLAGCNSMPTSLIQPPSQPPVTARACSSAGTVSLSAYQGTVIDCSQGNAVVLPGSGAHYLIVPEFALTDTAEKPTGFDLGVTGSAATAAALAPANPATRVPPLALPRRTAPDLAQIRFDRALRTHDRTLARRWLGTPSPLRTPAVTAAVPPLGSLRSFSVSQDTLGAVYRTSTARLEFIGQNVLVYVDTLSPAGGFTSAQLQAYSQLVDQTMYVIDASTFGAPTDIDANGHVILLLTQYVNALTPASGGCNGGFIAGFFDGTDLAAPTNPHSNLGEVFYSVVPDPAGKYGCPLDLATVEYGVPGIFLHEMQHMISFGRHVLIHDGEPEDGWVDEGLSLVAEEQGSRYYENRYPPPLGRTNPAQLFPDSAESFIGEELVDSYSWLMEAGTFSVNSHSDADLGLEWRAGDWLLMRWLGDRKDSTIFARLDDSPLTGPANLSSAMGEPFPQLFGEFGVALYADSIPGAPRSAVPGEFRFSSRNLRELYLAVYNASYPDPSYPWPFPILPTLLSSASPAAGTMVPGAPTFYRLDTPASAAQVTVTFTGTGGTQLPAALQPQLAIFRLPN